MNRIKRVLSMAVLLLLLMVSLTGCGSGATVNTTLTVNDDFSGVRAMQMVFSTSTFNSYFKGTIDDLNRTLDENKPSSVTYDYHESNGNYYYQFYIEFSSIEDYNAKVNAITGDKKKVVISCPDSVWVSGIYVEEDYTSTDLLQWLSSALVNNGLLSSSYVDNLFGSGDTKVIFAGKEIDSNKQIYVDQIEYLKIDSVDIYTDINDLETIDRTVKFVVPAESINKKGAEIEDAMNSIKPSLADMEKEVVDGSTVYSYTGRNLSVEDTDGFMKSIFGQNNAFVSTENVDDYYSPFSFNKYFLDYYNLNDYVFGNNDTLATYLVKSNNSEYEFRSESPFSVRNDSYIYGVDTTDESGYDLLAAVDYYGSDNESISIPLLIQKNYRVKNVDANLEKGLFSDWSRTVTFTLDSVPTEEEGTIITGKVESRYKPQESLETEQEEVSESAEREAAEVATYVEEEKNATNTVKETMVTSVSAKSGENFTLIITQKGPLNAIQEEAEKVFSHSQESEYVTENGLLKLKKFSSIEDSINLGNYAENKTDDYAFNYTVGLGIAADVVDINLNEDEYTVEGGKIKITNTGDEVYLNVVYTAMDIWLIGAFILALLFIVLVIVSVVTSGVIKIERKVQSSQESEVASSGKTIYCGKCGTPNASDSMFCANCGEKLGE